MKKFIFEYLNQYFDKVEPYDFYRDLFPLGELEETGKQINGKYNAIAVELQQTEEAEPTVKRHLIHNELCEISQLLDSENFIIISPISYCGVSRAAANARFIYAIAIDLDGITKENHIIDLFQQIEHEAIPKPTHIVFSGSGLHLYYQFKNPLPCFRNITQQLTKLKNHLTWKIWNKYTTELYRNIQYESLFQGFRMVGGITKDGGRTSAYRIGEKIDIEYLNSFVAEEYKVKISNSRSRSRMTLTEAAKKYPVWYENRIVQQQPKGTWRVKKDLFEWWIRKIKEEAKEGHRYYCIMCLAAYAKKCGISKEELEKAAFDMVYLLDSRTETDDNNFTRQDILAALEMYNDSYISLPIDTISKLTDIKIEKNKRNYRKQKVHLQIARATKEILAADGANVKGGRKSKENIVIEWQKQNPNGSKADCIRDTGLSKPTVYKYYRG